MVPHLRPRTRDEFEIAIICALPLERNAIEALLEEDYEKDGLSYGKAAGDSNTYTLGCLGNQNVVLAYMPGTGTVSAAAVAANLRSSFEALKMALVVGICGGVPMNADGEEILLGDVIISTSVIQVDFGRLYPHKFIRKKDAEDTLSRAGTELRAFISKMSGFLMADRLKEKTSTFSAEICSRKEFRRSIYPGPEKDQLYKADFPHKHWKPEYCTICDKCETSGDEVCDQALGATCTELGCGETKLVKRDRLQEALGRDYGDDEIMSANMQEARKPCIHFGRMACSNQVMKSGHDRDRIATEEGEIGFEMESAGTWEYIPTLVIKSVCDYADSHKNKMWQPYAATTAAACTKAILEEWRGVDKPSRHMSHQEHLLDLTAIRKELVQLKPKPVTNPVHCTVSRAPSTLFTGRVDILGELETIIENAVKTDFHDNYCWIVISGMGGQGKSEICLQLVQRVRES